MDGELLRVKSDERKKGILWFVLSYTEQHDYPPTQNEIATGIKMPVSLINTYVADMAKEGLLKAQAHASRSIVVTEKGIEYCNSTLDASANGSNSCLTNPNKLNTIGCLPVIRHSQSESVSYPLNAVTIDEALYFSKENMERVYKFKAVDDRKNKILHLFDGDELSVKACKYLKDGQWFVALYGTRFFLVCNCTDTPYINVATDEKSIVFRKNETGKLLIVGEVIQLKRNFV